MVNNDVLRSLRYIINVSDRKIVEIFALGGFNIPVHLVQDYLKTDDEPGYILCDDESITYFLNGLIYFKRGKDDSRPAPELELPVSNNLVLKKLRVTFNLKEADLHEILETGGYKIGRAELSAFLRKRGHSNYRECGDQILRYFLKGLKLKYRGED